MVEKSSGVKPCKIADALSTDDDRQIVDLILDKYKDHSSISAINQNSISNFNSFSFHEVKVCQVRKQLKSLDGRKSTGEDQSPLKLVLTATDELALPLRPSLKVPFLPRRIKYN